jgi:hypothetical protein
MPRKNKAGKHAILTLNSLHKKLFFPHMNNVIFPFLLLISSKL